MAALTLHDVHRELDTAADILVVAVDRLERHVAEHRMIDRRLDAGDQVAFVDERPDGRLVVTDERDHRLLSAFFAIDGRVASRRRTDEAVRHHPDFELLHPWRIGVHDVGLRLLADDRLLAAAAGRILALHPHAIDA